MSSTSSYSYSSEYTSGGGSNSEEIIHLCAAGHFNFSSSSFISVDASGSSAYSNNEGGGSGTWTVIGNANGEPVLQLKFNDGKINEYIITESDSKTFLNGYRYFRTYGTTTDDGPNCE